MTAREFILLLSGSPCFSSPGPSCHLPLTYCTVSPLIPFPEPGGQWLLYRLGMLAIPPSSSSTLPLFTPPDSSKRLGAHPLTFPWGPGSHFPPGGLELKSKGRRGDLRQNNHWNSNPAPSAPPRCYLLLVEGGKWSN